MNLAESAQSFPRRPSMRKKYQAAMSRDTFRRSWFNKKFSFEGDYAESQARLPRVQPGPCAYIKLEEGSKK